MPLNIRKGILIVTYSTHKLANMYLGIEDIGVFANLLIEFILILIALIRNLTHNLLKDIL